MEPTLDLLSGGRAEIMAGRGSFVESFPLFGHDLDDYDELFGEKLDLLLAVRDSAEHVTWTAGRHRAPIHGRGVYPRPLQESLPVWIAVGGSAPSAVRAGRLGLPMALAIIGGLPERFAPFATMMNRIGRERGWPPMTREQFDASTTLRGANLVGSPQEVAEKILFQHEIFGHDRTLVQFSVGALPHDRLMRSIELFGTEVAPLVRDGLARRAASATPAAV